MGTYLNPGNNGFAGITGPDYVDKTGLISLINKTIGKSKKLTCISRPRRFGKSYAAQMLCAYYDKTCDSHNLFAGYTISRDNYYETHINKYHVIYLDMTNFISDARNKTIPIEKLPNIISDSIMNEVYDAYPQLGEVRNLTEGLLKIVEITGTEIVFIIDEWDAVIREASDNPEAQQNYLYMLRSWFKNGNFTPKAVAAAYMTGILPIKKDGSQSAISDFQEYSMLDPMNFAEYVGFTESEVIERCETHHRNFDSMKRWYDGYTVGDQHSIYNPYSVMQALASGNYKSYWKKTSAAETLMTYIDMDMEGLQEDIARLIAGEEIVVDTYFFQNDVSTFTCKDDVLTLLIHLGYLSYEEVPDSYDEEDEVMTGLARIPNEEVRIEFEKTFTNYATVTKKHNCVIEMDRK